MSLALVFRGSIANKVVPSSLHRKQHVQSKVPRRRRQQQQQQQQQL
jgi:heme exporter protein D